MRKYPEDAHTESGYAMLLALLVLLVTSSASMLAYTALRLEMQDVQREARRIRLQALSDAAVAETLAQLDRRPGFRGLARAELGAGWYQTSIRRTGAVLTINAQAHLGVFQRRVEVNVRISGGQAQAISWKPLPPNR